MVRATYAATEKWEAEVKELFPEFAAKCNEEQPVALDASQAAWEQFYKAEQGFIAALRQTVHGSMYRPITANIFRTHARDRAMALRSYLDDWLAER